MTETRRIAEGTKERLKRAAQAPTFAGASNALFGGLVDRYGEYFAPLEDDLKQANLHILFRTYVSEIFMAVTLAFITGLLSAILLVILLPIPIFLVIFMVMFTPVFASGAVFAALYLYPSQRAENRKSDIEKNLPFALNHMSAVAGSGVPPSAMFELLVNFDEYGEISTEANKVVTQVRAFGEDVTTALREVARETPSDDLQEVFFGIISTIQTGGNLEEFLQERADRALFDYRMKREKQIDRLSTLAGFYTAVLIAAPLFIVTILAVLSVISDQLMGFPITATCGFLGALLGQCPIGLLEIGAFFVIPSLNILYLVVLQVFQPDL